MNLWKQRVVLGSMAMLVAVGAALAQNPIIAVPPNKALLIVRLPAGARLQIADYTAQQDGAERLFYTPDLAADQLYAYTLEARWTLADGSEKKARKKVVFQAGDTKTIDFLEVQAVEKKPVEKKPIEAIAGGKERHFQFTYAGIIKDLPPGKSVRVWLPVPTSGPDQAAKLVVQNLPAKGKRGKDKQYGNDIMYFEAKANEDGEIPFELLYDIKRREVKTNLSADLVLQPSPKENLRRFLLPDAKVPVDGKPLDLIKNKKLPADQFAAAKALYDVVNNHMKYSKVGTGWGQGDAVWACDSKFGNCSDFHSLFISMARGNKIPSKFEMGFPIPPKHGAGMVGGYHCWAWFLPNNRGWVPVDISEANRNPELKEYYFGNLTEDRVRFSTGRDIDLEPRQTGKALNFFIYPYAEVDGKAYPQEKIARRFEYRDVQ